MSSVINMHFLFDEALPEKDSKLIDELCESIYKYKNEASNRVGAESTVNKFLQNFFGMLIKRAESQLNDDWFTKIRELIKACKDKNHKDFDRLFSNNLSERIRNGARTIKPLTSENTLLKGFRADRPIEFVNHNKQIQKLPQMPLQNKTPLRMTNSN